jgi:hypothetical protein
MGEAEGILVTITIDGFQHVLEIETELARGALNPAEFVANEIESFLEQVFEATPL